MKSKSLILMFVSLGFGLIAAIGISQVMGKNKGPVQPQIRMGTVLIASKMIDINQKLNAEVVSVEKWPLDIIPPNACTKIEDVENKVTTTRYSKGAPLILEDLIDESRAHELPIPPGYKVVGINVNADDTIYGLLSPGHYIDVIGIFQDRSSGKNTVVTRTFLKNIQVFSVDKNLRRDPTQKETGSAKQSVLGVLVNQKQAEELVLAQKGGNSLKIMLRSKDDEDTEPDSIDDLVRYQPPVSEAIAIETPTQPIIQEPTTEFRQVIWLGDERVEIAFDANRRPIKKGADQSTTPKTYGWDALDSGKFDDWINSNEQQNKSGSGKHDVDFDVDEYSGS